MSAQRATPQRREGAPKRRYMRTATAISFLGTANPQAGQSTFHGRSLGRVNDSLTEVEIHSSADRQPGLILCRSGTEAIQELVASSFRPDDQQAEVTPFLHAGARSVDYWARVLACVSLSGSPRSTPDGRRMRLRGTRPRTYGRRMPASACAPAPAGLPSSTRSDPALVAPALRDDGLTALLALEELGYESRDLGGPLQWE
jgi:hypothetical protein